MCVINDCNLSVLDDRWKIACLVDENRSIWHIWRSECGFNIRRFALMNKPSKRFSNTNMYSFRNHCCTHLVSSSTCKPFFCECITSSVKSYYDLSSTNITSWSSTSFHALNTIANIFPNATYVNVHVWCTMYIYKAGKITEIYPIAFIIPPDPQSYFISIQSNIQYWSFEKKKLKAVFVLP